MLQTELAIVYQDAYHIIADYTKKLTTDPELVSEITQVVFIKLHDALPTLREPEKLAAWLRRIVYTTLMEQHRKRPTELSLAGIDVAETEANQEGNEAVLGCLKLLLQVLPPAQRTLLEAVELQGISQTQYAATHQLPVSTVKSRVQRARQKLKAQLTSHCFLTTDPYGNIVDFSPPAFPLG